MLPGFFKKWNAKVSMNSLSDADEGSIFREEKWLKRIFFSLTPNPYSLISIPHSSDGYLPLALPCNLKGLGGEINYR